MIPYQFGADLLCWLSAGSLDSQAAIGSVVNPGCHFRGRSIKGGGFV